MHAQEDLIHLAAILQCENMMHIERSELLRFMVYSFVAKKAIIYLERKLQPKWL